MLSGIRGMNGSFLSKRTDGLLSRRLLRVNGDCCGNRDGLLYLASSLSTAALRASPCRFWAMMTPSGAMSQMEGMAKTPKSPTTGAVCQDPRKSCVQGMSFFWT